MGNLQHNHQPQFLDHLLSVNKPEPKKFHKMYICRHQYILNKEIYIFCNKNLNLHRILSSILKDILQSQKNNKIHLDKKCNNQFDFHMFSMDNHKINKLKVIYQQGNQLYNSCCSLKQSFMGNLCKNQLYEDMLSNLENNFNKYLIHNLGKN